MRMELRETNAHNVTPEEYVVLTSPYFEVFSAIEAERQRSCADHGDWSNRVKYTVRAMHALTAAELAECLAAIEMGDLFDAIREFTHTANCACKAIHEIDARGKL